MLLKKHNYLAQLVTICTDIIHITFDMYKKSQKLYISVMICIKSIHIVCYMYKKSQKLYISGMICIKSIHIPSDMYKNCEKVYIFMSLFGISTHFWLLTIPCECIIKKRARPNKFPMDAFRWYLHSEEELPSKFDT